MAGHDIVPGVMPASFKVAERSSGKAEVVPDFGDRAIGRVAPVDSIMWWVGLLKRYVQQSGDVALAREPIFQHGLRAILDLFLKDTFEIFPTLLTPDGCFMIDRRMGVYGHPLEVQALFYEMLRCMPLLLAPNDENKNALALAMKRADVLREYVRNYYWLDLKRLNAIHRRRAYRRG